jgi:hypothetical protein
MPTTVVDTETFNALHLAQATINYVRLTLTYGSANQIKDLTAKYGRDGATPVNGRTLPSLVACRDGVKLVLKQPHARPAGWLGSDLYREGIGAGVAAYYRAGNCGEHATVAFCYLAHLGYPGITITRCSSKLEDHAFVLIEGKGAGGKPFGVICDPWPSNAQAVLWSDHFCYRAGKANQDLFDPLSTFEVTPDRMGDDPMVEAFKAVDPAAVSKLTPNERIKGLDDSAIDGFITKFRNDGLYTLDHTTTGPAFQDYANTYHDPITNKDVTQTLSALAGFKDVWTAKLQPVLTSVVDPIGTSVKLDPKLKYQ